MHGLHSNQEVEVVEEVVQPETKLFNSEDRQYFPSGRHMWRQQGPYLVCRECPLEHAVYIGIDKEMIGENEDGEPVLRDRVSV